MRWPWQRRSGREQAPVDAARDRWGTVTYEMTGEVTSPVYHPPGPAYRPPPEPAEPAPEPGPPLPQRAGGPPPGS